MNRTHLHLRRRRARQQREGAALLIVLFVLLMATSTAAYTLQSTQFEVRAAGSLHQAMRTKFAAEAATVGVLALCYQASAIGCTDVKRAPDNVNGTLRQLYGLPNWAGTEMVYSLTGADLAGTAFPSATPLLADERTIVGTGGGTAARYTPSFDAVIEKWDVPNPGETRQRYRLIVSTYASLNYDSDANAATVEDVAGTGEIRLAHQTISATRAFFDLK